MKKITVLALVASLALAAPALAQTPADVKNFRDPATTTQMSPVAGTSTNAAPMKAETSKKAAKKSKKASKKASKKSKTEAKAAEKKDEMKKEDTKDESK